VHTSARAAIAAAVTTVTVLTMGGVASADRLPPKPKGPTQAQVDKAAKDVQAKTLDVASIQASLVVASQRLATAAEQADLAAEQYNGALWRLSVAKKAVKKAQAEAAEAKAGVAGQRTGIAQLITQSYQEGTALNSVTAVMSSDGPKGVMDRYGAFQSASDSMQADYERFRALTAIYLAYAATAKQAQARQAALAVDAKKIRDKAESLAAYAQSEANLIAYRKQQLIAELATAENISVQLATTRQKALEAAARLQQEVAGKAQALAAAKVAAKDAENATKAAEGSDEGNIATFAPGAYFPQPAPGHAPAVSVGVQRAISFASQQLGEPYVWAAAGPSSWDCSGLTMMAWRAGGISLPHYSAAQFAASTPISVIDLKPGDLVFWGGSPSTIHHVALYIGNNLIIQAPHTGAYVEISNMYASTAPNFFARPTGR
jgi:cell wall-associated NlpC family hydrolase